MTLQQIQIKLKEKNNIAATREAWPEDEYIFQGGGYIMDSNKIQNLTALNLLTTFGKLNDVDVNIPIKVGYHIDKVKIKEDLVEYITGWKANDLDIWADDYRTIELPADFIDARIKQANIDNESAEQREKAEIKLKEDVDTLLKQQLNLENEKLSMRQRDKDQDIREGELKKLENELKAREEKLQSVTPDKVTKNETKAKTKTT